jgi:hypothetical protein
MRKLFKGAVAGVVLATAFPATAHADPTGCGGAAYIGISNTGVMTPPGKRAAMGLPPAPTGSRSKQDISFQTDLVVAANSQTGQGRGYYVQVSSCDNGKTANYYGRGFFTTYTTYHDTASNRWHVC